jgi:hypothetical protein
MSLFSSRPPAIAAASCLFFAVAILVTRVCAGAEGEQPASVSSILRISSVGDCPTADAIAQTGDNLVPHPPPEALRRTAEVGVTDGGETYRVRLVVEGKTYVRAYRDVGRDCAQRARVVAVFIVLTLMPPELLVEPPPEPPAAPSPPIVVAPPPTPVAPPPSWRFALGVAGVVDMAPAVLDAPSIVSAGAELRASIAKRRFATELGLGLQPQSDLTVAGLNARQRRVPFDVSVAVRQPVRATQLGAAVGIAGAIFDVEAQNLPITSGGTRLDLGGRVALEVRLASASGRIAAFAGAHALLFPKRYELTTAPSGIVGHTPAFWFGANLGAAMAF